MAFCEKPKNRQKSSNHCSVNGAHAWRTQKIRFFGSRRRLGVDFDRPEALPGAPGRSSWRSGPPLGPLRALPGRCRDDPGTIPGHVENAPDGPWELLGRQGVPGRLLGAILSRFWVPRGFPWKRFCAISALIFIPMFAIISSLLSVIFGDSHDFDTRRDMRRDVRRDTIDKTQDETGDGVQGETRASGRT